MKSAIRRLWARPAHAGVVILTLALAIGANTAVFSVVNGVLLKPLPYPESERLVQIFNSYPKMGVLDSSNTVIDYLDRRQGAGALAQSALYYHYSYDLIDAVGPVRLQGVSATPSLFDVLGVKPRLGRTFAEEESSPGNQQVVVLSDKLWRTQFGADPDIIGREVRLSGQPHTIIGVMPAGFAFPDPQVKLWVPFVFSERQLTDQLRGFEFAQSIGRLKADASIAQLESQFAAIIASNIKRLSSADSADSGSRWAATVADKGLVGRAVPLHSYRIENRAGTLWLLQGAVLLVLAIACANVANLMLISFHQRRRELSLRAALGASRWRVTRPLLVESGLISAIGGALCMIVAIAGMGVLRASGLDGASKGFAPELDLRALLFVFACMFLTTVSCGLAPALSLSGRRSGGSISIDDGDRSRSSRPARRLRAALVVAQIAISVALLASGGLLLRSFLNLQATDPGFQAARLVSVGGQLSRDRYSKPEQTRAFLDRLLTEVRSLPGVASVGLLYSLPFSSDYGSAPYFIEGDEPGDGSARTGDIQTIDEHYFSTMAVPLLKGRGFNPDDDDHAPPVVIIDAELARQAFGERDPIGERIATSGINGELLWRTIVGVAASIRQQSLAQPAVATYYWPYRQSPTRIFRLVIKTDLPLAQLGAGLNEVVGKVDPEQPLFDLISMQQRIEDSLEPQRRPLQLVMLFAGIALTLAAIGTYAVLAFGVAQRRGEIGVRLSLGAQRRDILGMVFADGVRLVLVGLVIGLGIWLLLGKALRSQLYSVSDSDPMTAAAVAVLTLLVALLATWIPARRAASTEAIIALRTQP
ncbi:MAG: ABC transporter permease [Xanthomonadales bacterium]|nr:ABC transporter permease [Xanthomonadales bacterium]